MSHQIERAEFYRTQLGRWAQALSKGCADDVSAALADGSSPEQVRMFTEGNRFKRQDKLLKSQEFLAGTFDDFEDLVSTYVREAPTVAYDTTADDGERFLSWLERAYTPTPSQRDYLACQRARLAVEAVARANRRGHLRFQELWSVASRIAVDLDRVPGPRVRLNPIHAWSRFVTPALLDDDAALPADVLFFAARDTIRTAVLETQGQALVEELASCGPLILDEWAALSRHADREELVALCRDLAEMGLVAFE